MYDIVSQTESLWLTTLNFVEIHEFNKIFKIHLHLPLQSLVNTNF